MTEYLFRNRRGELCSSPVSPVSPLSDKVRQSKRLSKDQKRDLREYRKPILEEKVTFRLDGKRVEQLQNYADDEGVSVSSVVRRLVVRFLQDQNKF